jgi:hypothetical protein
MCCTPQAGRSSGAGNSTAGLTGLAGQGCQAPKIERSQMGNDSLDNLVTLCAYCHRGEHGQLFYSVPAARVCSKPKSRKQ